MGRMKKWFFVLVFMFLISAVILSWKQSATHIFTSENRVLSATEAPSPSPTPHIWKQSAVINFNNAPIRISWAIVEPKDVELYSNLQDQKLSEEIKVNRSCSTLVNGGFYSKENTHLGLFIANFETISQPIQSALLNGYLWIDSNNIAIIDTNSPKITPRVGLQSGPIIISNSIPLALSINNDSLNRRIVAATTANNQLYFLVVYRDGSEYQGPLLGDLPKIVDLFAKKNNINIQNAINLDGGSASVFISNYDRLVELSHIGSYFCIK